jgi:glycosyltransferase involved in cell wall biosynthesis
MSSDISSDNRISVVIPLYNHAEYIEEAVRSVLGQTVNPAEIIVVDDGSTDASAARMRALCEKYPQIIFWSQPNQGAHYTLNAGIHRATGEFVSILNSDDAYSPTRFEECLKVLQRHPDVSAVATGLTFIDENSVEISNQWYEDAKSFYDRTQDLSLALINGNFFVTTSNVFARRAVFDEIGHFAPLLYTHDLDFFLRLLASKKDVYFLDQPLLSYRLHQGNTIRADSFAVKTERAAVVAYYLYSVWSNHADDAKDWRGYIEKLTEIADRQALGAPLSYFLDHLDRAPPPGLQFGLSNRYDEFRKYMREAAGKGSKSTARSASIGDQPQDTQWLVAQNAQLREELMQRDAQIAEQRGWIGKLEEGKQWLAGQNEKLKNELETRDMVIADQKGWIGKLEEGKQWLVGQNEQLQQELEKRDAVIADQRAWIGKLEEGKQWLAARNEQLESEIDAIKRSKLWRILRVIGLNPGSRQ